MNRVVTIQPDALVGVLGQHENFPIECIHLSHDKKFLASCSHDNSVKFWSLDDDDGEEQESETTTAVQRPIESKPPSSSTSEAEPAPKIEGDEEDQMSESDSDQSDEDELPPTKQRSMAVTKVAGKRNARKRNRKGFFNGLR